MCWRRTDENFIYCRFEFNTLWTNHENFEGGARKIWPWAISITNNKLNNQIINQILPWAISITNYKLNNQIINQTWFSAWFEQTWLSLNNFCITRSDFTTEKWWKNERASEKIVRRHESVMNRNYHLMRVILWLRSDNDSCHIFPYHAPWQPRRILPIERVRSDSVNSW